MTIFRHVLYQPNGPRLMPLVAPLGYSFSSPFNEVGSAAFEYLTSAPGFAELLNPVELAIEASVTGETWSEIPNGRYIRLSRDYEKIGPGNSRKFSFTGYAWQLKKVLQWKTTELNADGKRPFLSATVGTIVKTLLDEAHARGTVPGLTYDFTTAKDSSGVDWAKVITIYYEPGLNLYTILDNLAQQGMCDWRMVGRTLQLFNADGALADSKLVKLKPGVDLKALPVKGSIEELVSHALVLGDEGRAVTIDNPSVVMPWGRWETSISNSGVSDPTTMQLLGTALLENGAQEKVQYTGEMKLDTTTYHPFFDFVPGFYISGPSETSAYEAFRVRQINASTDNEGKLKIDLILNDRFIEREIRNAKKTNGITGGASAGGSGGRPTPATPVDGRVPKAPQGFVVDSSAYIGVGGQPLAQVQFTWEPVTQATDNTALDSVTYQVEYRLNGGSDAWRFLSSTSGTTLSYVGLPVGTAYQFRVRAASSSARYGAYSTVVSHTTSTENSAPPKPSKPVLSSKLGTVTVRWDGKSETGATMPQDFHQVKVWRQGTTSAELVGTIMGGIRGAGGGFIVVTGLAVSLQTFWFTAIDTSNNESEVSESSQITVVRVSGPDIEANSVTTNELAVGAVQAVNIATEALQTRHLAIGVMRTNLVKNGGFEDVGVYPPPAVNTLYTAIPGWTMLYRSGGADYFRYLDMANVRTGRGCVVLRQGTTAENGALITSDPMVVTAGQTYRLSLAFKSAHVAASTVGVRILWSMDGGLTYSYGTFDGWQGNAAAGTFYSWYWTPAVPAGATHAKLEIRNRGDGSFANTVNAIVVDDVSFVPTTGPSMDISPGGIRFFNSSGVETISIDGAGATLSAGTLNGININASGGVKITAQGGIAFGNLGTASIGYRSISSADYIASEGLWQHGANSPEGQNAFQVLGPIACEPPTTTGSANTLMNGSTGAVGNIWKIGSLSKYKLEQEPITEAFYELLDLEPKTWVDKAMREEDPDFNQRYAGFIAEELEALSKQHGDAFEPIISREADGTLQGVSYDRIVAYLLPIMRDMHRRLTQLEEK